MTRILRRDNPLCIKTDGAIRVSRIVFYISYALYLILMIAANTTYKYDHSTKFLTQGAWVCCIFALISVAFLCRYTIGQILGILALWVLGFVVWICTQQSEYLFLQSMLLIFAARHVKWENLLRFSIIIYTSLIFASAIAACLGALPHVDFFRGDTPRYTLGFSHPNVLGGYVLFIVIAWMLLRYRKLKIYDYIGWLLIAAFMWIVPNSKTSTFSILIICGLAFIFKNWGAKLMQSRVMKVLSLGFFALMAGFSFLASYFYDADNALYVTIDHSLFTTRLSLAHAFYDEYPITLFGQKLNLVNSTVAKQKGIPARILDNYYVRQLLGSGIVLFLILLIIFTYLVYRAIRTDNQAMLIGLIVIMIYCIYENRGSTIIYNILLFQLAYQFQGELVTEEVNYG